MCPQSFCCHCMDNELKHIPFMDSYSYRLGSVMRILTSTKLNNPLI